MKTILITLIAVAVLWADSLSTPEGKTGTVHIRSYYRNSHLYLDSTYLGRNHVERSLDTGTYELTEQQGDSVLYKKEITFEQGQNYKLRTGPKPINFQIGGGVGYFSAKGVNDHHFSHQVLQVQLGVLAKDRWYHGIIGLNDFGVLSENDDIGSYRSFHSSGIYQYLFGGYYCFDRLFRPFPLLSVSAGVRAGFVLGGHDEVIMDTMWAKVEKDYRDPDIPDYFYYDSVEVTFSYESRLVSVAGLGTRLLFGKNHLFLELGYALNLAVTRHYQDVTSGSYFREYRLRPYFEQNGEWVPVDELIPEDDFTSQLSPAHLVTASLIFRF